MQKRKLSGADDDEVVRHFIVESNAIEGVYSEEAVQDSFRAWEYLKRVTWRQLRPQHVYSAHARIMARQRIPSHYKGEPRDIPVYIAGYKKDQPRHIVEWQLELWCDYVNLASLDSSGVIEHVAFEEVHPFYDGNGRVGRMLLNWQRMKNKLPLLIYEASNRAEYYKIFEDAHGITPFWARDWRSAKEISDSSSSSSARGRQ